MMETIRFRVKWPESYGLFGFDFLDFGRIPGARWVQDQKGVMVLLLPEPFEELVLRNNEQLTEEKAEAVKSAFRYFGVLGRC